VVSTQSTTRYRQNIFFFFFFFLGEEVKEYYSWSHDYEKTDL
jgi:hypothetical protein